MPPAQSETDILAPDPLPGSIAPVVKRIRVRANQARAFKVFTDGMDSWWPKTHHIGSSPMTKCVLEGRVGGRCYSEQQDGTECAWGQVLAWDPPARFVMAWMIRPNWEFEPDLAKCSEIEVTFTALPDGSTDVVLEHRNFERHGAGGVNMRGQVNQQGGWAGLMALFGAKAEEAE
jgi:uncharacterized protein YndB with AHSA1/START domain